jgi:hypothetical protein
VSAFLVILACLFFAAAVLGWGVAYTQRHQLKVDTAALKKVGAWYEGRVAELEDETRQLAEQVLIAGSIPRHAMPLPEPGVVEEYASDATGLISERLDPRDLPVG